MTAVATDTRLVGALRTLVELADRFEPEWTAPATLAAYRAAVLEGRVALLEAEQADPEPVGSAVVIELPAPVPVALEIAA